MLGSGLVLKGHEEYQTEIPTLKKRGVNLIWSTKGVSKCQMLRGWFMKKTAHVALAVVALMGVSVSGCSGLQSDEQASGAGGSRKDREDIDRISAALSM